MGDYKGLFIVGLGMLLALLSVTLDYYKIAPIAGLGVLIASIIGMYGFIVHVRIVNKQLFKLFKSNDDSDKQT